MNKVERARAYLVLHADKSDAVVEMLRDAQGRIDAIKATAGDAQRFARTDPRDHDYMADIIALCEGRTDP